MKRLIELLLMSLLMDQTTAKSGQFIATKAPWENNSASYYQSPVRPTLLPRAPQPETRGPNRLTDLTVAEALREARLIHIQMRSAFCEEEKLERELLKRKEFDELGLGLTRNRFKTELILEVTRKKFTTRFTCSIIEPTTERVLGAVTASSLGGEIEPHLAEAILKFFKAAREKQPRTGN